MLRGNMTANNLSYRQRIYEGRTAQLRGTAFTDSKGNQHASTAQAGVASHHADVPGKGGGGHGGNPNHDEHGRFT